MKKRSKIFVLLILFLSTTLIGRAIDKAKAASITISKKAITLHAGSYQTLRISGTKKKVTWSSSKKSVATVSSSGKVTAKAKGTAKITATVAGKKLTCTVTVLPPIKISSTSATLYIGDSKTLKITGTTKKVTWSSSKKSVATVSSSGKVTAKAAGTATITAKVAGKVRTCKITVKTPIKISASSASLYVGDSKTVKITGTSSKVTWSSSKTSVATVNSSGKITAKSPGTATITASVDGKKLTCKVTVKAVVTPTPTVKPTPTVSPAPIKNTTSPTKKIVGYYAAWARYSGYTPDKIDAKKLTHINYAFANIGSDLKIKLGYPDIDEANIKQLIKLKQSNPSLKLLIAIGGWTWSGRFSDVALTMESRNTFAESCLEFILKYGFDGIDLDWEYPVSGGLETNTRRPEDKKNFTLLMKILREKLDAQGKKDGKQYVLSFAGALGSWYINNIEASELSKYVNYVNVMSYDLHGPWEQYTGYNAPLFNDSGSAYIKNSVDVGIRAWLQAGFPKSQIVMGIPFYGYIYQAVADVNNGLGQTYSGGASINYANIVGNYLNNISFRKYFDQKAMVPYMFNGSTFITYEDEQSITAKSKYVKENDLSGVMIWELSQDPNEVLLDAIYSSLILK
ncbi:Ig-like domain-containing protein [Lachnospiraceae bacterium MD1]|uniref:chitinase n=1 Tax=Variimorphobacter saccharofermentans TaxID=2755051 RepID=A0A839JYA4_9FIRM|nr:glycosyl hydrolase family 18 protein [Variimorphobacter saccharofermentans]MBB2182410.1 Ig-like domain-containing protein [Variimorphobacter saccharofermentans]